MLAKVLIWMPHMITTSVPRWHCRNNHSASPSNHGLSVLPAYHPINPPVHTAAQCHDISWFLPFNLTTIGRRASLLLLRVPNSLQQIVWEISALSRHNTRRKIHTPSRASLLLLRVPNSLQHIVCKISAQSQHNTRRKIHTPSRASLLLLRVPNSLQQIVWEIPALSRHNTKMGDPHTLSRPCHWLRAGRHWAHCLRPSGKNITLYSCAASRTDPTSPSCKGDHV